MAKSLSQPSIFTMIAIVALICIFFQTLQLSVPLFAEAKSIQSSNPASEFENIEQALKLSNQDDNGKVSDTDEVANLTHSESSGRGIGNDQLFARAPDTFHRFYRRTPAPLSPQAWTDLTSKGCRFLQQLADPTTAGQYQSSPWTQFSQIYEWGWDDPDSDTEQNQNHEAGLGDIIPADADGTQYNWRHDKPNTIGGLFYPATGANYQNSFYPTLGVIVGEINEGPAYNVQEEKTPQELDGTPWDPTKDNLPKLKQWSDIVYLTWAELTKNNLAQRSGLKWVIRHAVANPVTASVITEVLKKNFPATGGTVPQWPDNKVITPKMDGWNALLGTPNVSGVMWLLIQHQADLGKKQVLSMTVYVPDQYSDPNINIALGPADDGT